MNRTERHRLRRLHERDQNEAHVVECWTGLTKDLGRFTVCMTGLVACCLVLESPWGAVAAVGCELAMTGLVGFVAVVIRKVFGVWPWRIGR